MANDFLKQEIVAFENMVEGFDDGLVIAMGAERFDLGDAQSADRAGDKAWIPAPMIGQSSDGFDASSNFGDATELAVPVSVGIHKHSAKAFTSKNLRNEYAVNQWFESAKQKLMSDVNMSCFNQAALYGGMFSKRTGAAEGFDDVAELDARFSEIGIPAGDRCAFYAPRAMNAMAGNLANRPTDNTRDRDAYSRALVGTDIAGFDVYKNDQTVRLDAASGGVTTVNGANQRTVPVAKSTSATGETENVDNRHTDLVVTSASYGNIKVGDAFTIAGVNAIHLITKQDTGVLKTFRVVGKPAANTIRIYPAIIDEAEASDASIEYANVSAGPANGAAITWLNTTTEAMSPFFKKDSLLILPGTYAVDPADGWQSLTATTEKLGIRMTYTRQGDIDDLSVKARVDIDYGTALPNPEMAGCQMFNQA